MTLAVLQEESEITVARQQMRARGVSKLPPPWLYRALRRLGLHGLIHGDMIKSWDVWKTALLLRESLPDDAPIVDLGAFRSEILTVLHLLGFTRLHGVDLNPAIVREPYHDVIDYKCCDFYNTPFEPGSFAAVTSISAIEHGLDLERLFAEVSRLLRPGGLFACSTDYWPEKIDTSGHTVFGMTWTIFSEAELKDLLGRAGQHGLEPVGAPAFEAGKPVVHHAGKDYTFAWFALRKVG